MSYYYFPLSCKVTPTMFDNAQAEANRIGLLRNSIRGGDGNLVGCIGEQGFIHLFPGSISDNTFHHDIIWNGLKIEVKTKQRKAGPRIYYEASVSNYNTTQQADYYAFMSVTYCETLKKYSRVHFCGLIPQSEYKEKAYFREAGTVDPSNGFDTPASCYNLSYRELIR